jgi:hypothetical protein
MVGRIDKIDLRIRWGGMPYSGAAGRVLVLVLIDDIDSDALGHHWGRMRQMVLVAKEELQGMWTGSESDIGLSLARAKVQMIEIIRDWLSSGGNSVSIKR